MLTNDFFTLAEEISRQLTNSGATIVFGLASMAKTLQQAVELTKRPIKTIYVKGTEVESLPAGGIDLQDLITTTGEKFFPFRWLMVLTSLILFLRGRFEQLEDL